MTAIDLPFLMRLLDSFCCDFMDRALYSPHSPLNWFTKRKRLLISKRNPDTFQQHSSNQHKLVNQRAIGELRLDASGKPTQISILTAEGKRIAFLPNENAEE